MAPQDPTSALERPTLSLATFGVADMIRCSASLRRLAQGCRSMEEPAQAIVQLLFEAIRVAADLSVSLRSALLPLEEKVFA
jgi:hypothetical protein